MRKEQEKKTVASPSVKALLTQPLLPGQQLLCHHPHSGQGSSTLSMNGSCTAIPRSAFSLSFRPGLTP